MKTILVPTDFSKNAAHAFRYALETASRNGAEVVALHVIFPNEGVENNVYSAFWVDEYYKQREKDVRNWANRLARRDDLKKVQVRSQCMVGFPVGSILEAVEREKASLVVMGTTGATGLRGVFLGSVAAGVIARTSVPVLVVPDKAKFNEKTRAVLATDFHLKKGEHTLQVLHDLPQLKNGEVHVVHVFEKPGEPDKARETAFGEKLGKLRHDFHYLHDRDVVQAVINFLESTDAGLLVAVAHEHSMLHRLFFDSMTRKLAQRVKIPTLALHDA